MDRDQISTAQLNSFYESLTHDLMKGHEKRFVDRVRSVKDAATGLASAGGRLSTGVKNAWGTLDKQTSEYAMRLAQILQDNAQSLMRMTPSADFRGSESFHEQAVEILNDIIITVRKYAPKIPKTLRLEMTILNGSLVKLEKAVKDFGEALDQSPGLKLELLRRDVESLLQKHGELAELTLEERKEAAFLEEISNREKKLSSEDSAMLSLPEYEEFQRYEVALRTKEDEIRQFLQPILKPLLKLERLRATRKGETLDVKTLHDLIERPIETVVSGQLFATTLLLENLGKALGNGELDLEDRKRRKAEEAIDEARNNALEKLRVEYLALQANAQESLRQMKSKGLVDKRSALEEQLAQTRAQIENIRGKQRELQRKNDDLSKAILKLKTSIENQTSKLAHKSVSIALD